MWLAAFFVLATLGSIVGLVLVAPRTVPPITGTVAFILTCAALGVAVLR